MPSNTITGYSMNDKSWNTLDVSRIHQVHWNDTVFEQLVLDRSAKELILALVTGRDDSKRDADLISGKRTGLVIRLRGAPGTGKTLTAESIAEFSRRPLYRVIVRDIGTSPEEVEKYLETVLTLGKLWDCVILLDEADSFLERRRTFDTERNAVVSVFLRVLDYFDGILILGTNRVGAFDEAFISRVQLSPLFKPFDETQRIRIWEAFCGVAEIRDARGSLAELAKVQMNGREIRNTISTSKQLALYRGERMTYQHIKVVIQQARSFNDNSAFYPTGDESLRARRSYERDDFL
ncbi:P-loop containing nucleoside triphosphate hydrolase protein [Halenospora varia]|nr:P-loop containing nucleoside triphosphate hydrolase protein [Halenospora varia]